MDNKDLIFKHFEARNFTNRLMKSLQVKSKKSVPQPITQKESEKMENNLTNNESQHINTNTETQRIDGAFNITAIGCGNAGGRVVDVLATKRAANNEPLYTCLAINSNDGDLKALRNVPKENQVDLELGGMGKNPKEGLSILNNDPKIIAKIKKFVIDNMKPISEDTEKKDLILLFAALGGGTGTSTILKLAQEFLSQSKSKDELYLEIFKEVLHELELTPEQVEELPEEVEEEIANEVEARVNINYEKNRVKVGIVAYLPDKNLSAKELKTVQEFCSELWELAKPKYDEYEQLLDNQVAFIHFPDNQHLADTFKTKLSEEQRKQFGNPRTFANYMVANTIHELNTIPKASSEDSNLDTKDFHRVILENCGYLSLNKNETVLSAINSYEDIVNLFMQGFKTGHLHSDLEIIHENKNDSNKKTQARLFNSAINVVIDDEISEQKMFNQLGDGRFIDEAREQVYSKYKLDGQFFEGFIKKPNNGNVSAYTIFKTDTLPIRVSKGLSEEIQAAQKNVIEYTETSSIEVSKLEDASTNKKAKHDFKSLLSAAKDSDEPKKDEVELSSKVAAFMEKKRSTKDALLKLNGDIKGE